MEPGLVLTIGELAHSAEEQIKNYCNQLTSYLDNNGFPVGDDQVIAWMDCFTFLQKQFIIMDHSIYNVPLLFEYMLPFENGRRPDVIMLLKEKVIILEFKMTRGLGVAATDQALGYREDIKHFHRVTAIKEMKVESYLVWTSSEDSTVKEQKTIPILTKHNFASIIGQIMKELRPYETVEEWYLSEYVVLPNMMTAVNDLFQNGSLPYIKNIADSDIEKSIHKINEIIEKTKRDHGKTAIILDGVPGSGKTLVGLKTVYDHNVKEHNALYLSGNGPLVNVLQAQLSTGNFECKDGKAYIKSMRAFKNEYIDKLNAPEQTIIVFDEAQRAWDTNKMKKSFNEIEGIMGVCNTIHRNQGYVVLLCLYGGGQSIYKGEEKGLKLWDVAINRYGEWNYYFSSNLASDLQNVDKVNRLSTLHLDTSIRNYFIDTSPWIEAVIKRKGGNLNAQRAALTRIENQNFRVRITRDFEEIKSVMPRIKKTQPNSRYGMIVSSYVETDLLKRYSNRWIESSYIKENEAASWFMGKCEELHLAASEFLCQGLELEMPIVMFGGDYYLDQNEWKTDGRIHAKYSKQYDDYGQVLENVYRVLLSRGRKGLILYIPEDKKLNETYKRFKDMGVEDLVPK